ncbi:response regulator [Sediminibacterium ginsengisoli]|uniref:histidine kinase n=1 Tax=Sediminibacterium ginsengisoli TaxID=413434 RepID=A0A1T4JZJ4_9BACT|nr:response regulator [Sediminibacterium ginsengisoli]SJZ35544.1 Signal transduction histidine kinase [Sediminibacterium ginsengisoli]
MIRSLPFKLYAGLVIAVLLVLIVGFVSVNALEKQEEEAELVRSSNQVITSIRQLRFELMRVRSARRSYWVTGNESYLDQFQKGAVAIPMSVSSLKQLVIDDAAQTNHIQKLDEIFAEIFHYWQKEGRITPEMDKAAFARVVNTEEQMLKNAINQFDTARITEERQLHARERSARKHHVETRTILFTGIGILMVVVLLLINSVLQTLKSRYKSGLKLKESLAEMEKINKSAQEKNWVLEGMSYVNNRMQLVDSTRELAGKIIDALVQYLELPAGVIYFYDEKEQKLFTVASVSVSSSASKEYRIGDGIVGNAALSKTPVLIKHIPPDYWKVESMLGQVTGNGEIICIPLWMNGKLKGLIELGCFESFSSIQLALLNSITDILSVAINSYQSRERIDILLEELQDQQEELRQINDELSRQTEELQASEEELKTQEAELKQINLDLKERNETIESARSALAIKAKELESASLYKSEFLANMSHELRTPLNSVLILAKLLADNTTGNLTEKQIEYAKIIRKSGKDLLDLINDILDLSKIEAGKVELDIQPVRITEIQADIRQLFSVVAAEKGIEFKTEIAADVPELINTDKQRVEQVIKNLLANAFKFTQKNGTVTLSMSNKNQFNEPVLSISVSDTGIGISQEKQQLIFDAFQQADGSTSRKYGGTGLGLSISKELVRLLNGSIDVFSTEGKGSTFTILLPYRISNAKTEKSKSLALSPTAVPELDASKVTLQQQVEDDRDNLEEGDRPILIIEDDVNFATIIKDFTRHKGYKAIVAMQGDEGLLYAQQYIPAAIILDMQLPVMDGWTLLKKFKADEKLKNIPVHIISAFDDNRLKHADVLAYLKKPVDTEELDKVFTVIEAHLRSGSKKMLLITDSQFSDTELTRLFREKKYEIEVEQVAALSQAKKAKENVYDCIIIPVGVDTDKQQLEAVCSEIQSAKIPLVLYLDEGISGEEEQELKKMRSDAMLRSSTGAKRLTEELELFLYKMKEVVRQPETIYPEMVNDTSLENKKILLVDDDMRNVFAISAALQANGMEVVAASDGKEAIEQLKRYSGIDLVLMDIMMPEMDGYEAMQKIRNEMKLIDIPIIALTAKAMAGDREKCIAAGASDYITKPVDMQKLYSLMRVWLTK